MVLLVQSPWATASILLSRLDLPPFLPPSLPSLQFYFPFSALNLSANMLAHRDQENLVHSHQTAAASKPLNQSLRQLQPKTPGTRIPKTPFKVPLNDENDPLTFGKKTIRGNTKKNDNTKPAKDAFLTPLGKTIRKDVNRN